MFESWKIGVDDFVEHSAIKTAGASAPSHPSPSPPTVPTASSSLTVGSPSVLPTGEVRSSPARLLQWLASERISLCFLPTPLAEAWNGVSWSIRTTPAPATFTQNSLSGVACPAATDCFAVGSSGVDAGSAVVRAREQDAPIGLQRDRVGPRRESGGGARRDLAPGTEARVQRAVGQQAHERVAARSGAGCGGFEEQER